MADYLGVDGEGVQTTASPLAHTIKAIKKYGCKARDKKVACSTNLGDDYMARYDRSLEKLAVWEYEGIPIEVLDFFQVRYDSVSNRLVYPIRDTGGNIINVCGRTLDPDFKAKRLPKYIYFKPLGTLATLFGWSENIEQIKQRKEVIIFEGAKSVMLARAWGINNTAALLTSHLNSNQLRLLLSLGCQLTFALDKEVDITEDKNILILKRYQKVYTIRDRHDLTGDKDAPVDKGEEVFRKLYSEKEAIN